MLKRICGRCDRALPHSAFGKRSDSRDGLQYACRSCEQARASKVRRQRLASSVPFPKGKGKTTPAERKKQELLKLKIRAKALEADRKRRERSEYEPLGVDNYRLETPDRDNYSTRGTYEPGYTAEKRQEYSKQMGRLADMFTEPESVDTSEQHVLGSYVSGLAEDERRFMNRRLARNLNLAVARDTLFTRQFRQACSEFLRGKIEPSGYAAKTVKKPDSRTVVLKLSDLHIGADLDGTNPHPWGAEQEARCLEKVLMETCDYKTRYRDQSRLLMLCSGDIIEGNLGHDFRAGVPTTEQFVAVLKYFGAFIQHASASFPFVDIEWVPGNHGRDKFRHPGRALKDRWDGYEGKLGFALQAMCANLPNVRVNVPLKPVNVIDLHGSKLLQFHGDGEPKTQHPDKGAEHNKKVLQQANSLMTYGDRFQAAAFGHWHTPRVAFYENLTVIANGMLIPPNEHARAENYVGEQRGQYLWEAVKGYPVGDIRFVQVDVNTDKDHNLNKVIKPFRFTR